MSRIDFLHEILFVSSRNLWIIWEDGYVLSFHVEIFHINFLFIFWDLKNSSSLKARVILIWVYVICLQCSTTPCDEGEIQAEDIYSSEDEDVISLNLA